MLENLVAWILKYYLDKYVENLNTDKLSIGLLQGEVELENLPLKKDALRQAGLPIQVTSGFIGKVKLQIPFRQIRSTPWAILIERLYLVAAPVKLSEWDEEAEEQALQDLKLASLAALEAQWRAEIEGHETGYYASSYSSWMNYGSSIVTNVIENLQYCCRLLYQMSFGHWISTEVDFFQLKISDVHFRYEDDCTLDGQCFSWGITIESLIAQSSNEKWEPGYTSGTIGYKVLELTKFSLYWDSCEEKDLIGKLEANDLIVALGDERHRGRNFLLSPVSAIAHLKRNRSPEPLRSRSSPRIICDLLLDEVPLTLSDVQYSQMVVWFKGLSIIIVRAKNRKYRPLCSVKEDCVLWWKYFVNASLKRPLVRCTWDIALERARENVSYVEIYAKILSNPAGALNEQQKALKEKLELERSLDEIRSLREVSLRRVLPPPTQSTSASTSKGFLLSFFPQWFYSTPASASISTDGDKRLEDDLLLDTFSDPLDDTTFLRRDVVFGQFNFSLKEGSINLCASIFENKTLGPQQSILELDFEKLMLSFESRPRSSSHKITIALGAMYLKDRLTKDTVFPVLVAPQGRELAPSSIDSKRNLPPNLVRLLSQSSTTSSATKPTEEPLFELTYEQKPFTCSIDYRLHIKTQCLDIVFNPGAISWLIDFFTKPHQNVDSSVRTAAKQKYQAIKKATKNELIKNWTKILAGDLALFAWKLKGDVTVCSMRDR